jgi:hypothetical protein
MRRGSLQVIGQVRPSQCPVYNGHMAAVVQVCGRGRGWTHDQGRGTSARCERLERLLLILIVAGMSDELFAAIDANGDGSITIDEFINYQRMSDEV